MASMLGVMSSSSPEFDDMFFPRLSVIWVTLSRDYSITGSNFVRCAAMADRLGDASRPHACCKSKVWGTRLINPADSNQQHRAPRLLQFLTFQPWPCSRFGRRSWRPCVTRHARVQETRPADFL